MSSERRDPTRVLVHRLHSRLGAVRLALEVLQQGAEVDRTAAVAHEESYLMAIELTILGALVRTDEPDHRPVDLGLELRTAAGAASMYGVDVVAPPASDERVMALASDGDLRRLLPALFALAAHGRGDDLVVDLDVDPSPTVLLRSAAEAAVDVAVVAAAARLGAELACEGDDVLLRFSAP